MDENNGAVICNINYMAVSMDEYADLIRADLTLDALLDALLAKAELSWDKESLRFDDSAVNHVLRALCRHKYYNKIMSLKIDKEIKEADNGTYKS